MQRKNYSWKKGIPRSTLWYQKNKKKKNTSEQQQEELSTSDQQGQLSTPAAEENLNTTEGVASLSDQCVGLENLDGARSASWSSEIADIEEIPRISLIRPCRDDSDSDYYESSDDELFGSDDPIHFHHSKESDSDSSSDSSGHESEEDKSSDTSNEESEESSNDTEQAVDVTPVCHSEGSIWLQKPTASTTSLPSAGTQDENRGCPPEVKYSTLMHVLRTKHQMSRDAIEDVMEIVNELSLDCQNKTVLPKDARTIRKKHEDFMPKYQKHYFCSSCNSYVGPQCENERSYTCENCKQCLFFKSSDYFYYVSMADQLRELFENNYEELSVVFEDTGSSETHLISSVKDGRKYKEYRAKVSDRELGISLTFSCDGVPVFSSSNTSLWPVLCTINELPMHVRKKYVLMPALFYGQNKNKKPDMNQFLYPLVAEECRLSRLGFPFYHDGEMKVCKVVILKVVADSVARPLLFNGHQFNGEWGCWGCYHPGQQVPKGRGTVRVYPHMEVELRTMLQTLRLAEEAAALEKPPFHVMGIKGKTILSCLSVFDIVRGLVPDYMHSSVLGTPRQIAKLWFSPTYRGKPFNICGSKDVVTARLQLLKLPFFVSRVPRSLDDVKFWKAHEWFIWTIFTSVVVLKGILPNAYLQHWMLYVEAIFLLTQETITKSQVYNAMTRMVQFTQGVETLYGLEHCSFNIHVGEHLGVCALDWGPAWEHSAFLYEDYNQILLKSIHSSKGVLEQVVNEISAIHSIPAILRTPVGPEISHLNVTRKDRSLSTKDAVTCSKGDCEVLMLSPAFRKIEDLHRLALASVNRLVKRKKRMAFSQRIISLQEVFHSTSYTVVKRRNSYTMLLDCGKIFSVDRYVCVDDECFALGKYLEATNTFKVIPGSSHNMPFQICVKQDVGPLCAVNVSAFTSKVVFLNTDHLSVNIVCIPPNRVEVLK